MREILINSKFRLNGTNENFNVEIPFCNKIKFLECFVPNTFPNVQAGTFTIIGANSGSNVFNISSGRFTPSSLVTYIQSLLTADIVTETYTITLDSLFRVNITATETFTTDFTGFSYLGLPNATGTTIVGTAIGLNPEYMQIKSANILGVDNGSYYNGETGILYNLPLCCGDETKYRNDNSNWVNLLNLPGEIKKKLTLNLYLSIDNMPVDLTGAGWFLKIIIV